MAADIRDEVNLMNRTRSLFEMIRRNLSNTEIYNNTIHLVSAAELPVEEPNKDVSIKAGNRTVQLLHKYTTNNIEQKVSPPSKLSNTRVLSSLVSSTVGDSLYRSTKENMLSEKTSTADWLSKVSKSSKMYIVQEVQLSTSTSNTTFTETSGSSQTSNELILNGSILLTTRPSRSLAAIKRNRSTLENNTVTYSVQNYTDTRSPGNVQHHHYSILDPPIPKSPQSNRKQNQSAPPGSNILSPFHASFTLYVSVDDSKLSKHDRDVGLRTHEKEIVDSSNRFNVLQESSHFDHFISTSTIAVIMSLVVAILLVIGCIAGFVATEIFCGNGHFQRDKISPCAERTERDNLFG